MADKTEHKPEAKGINKKHQEFINWYLQLWNQTEAYKRVYPKSTDAAARVSAARLLTNANISAEIQRRIDEQAMAADEVLYRLADQARGNMGDFVKLNEKGKPYIDLAAASKAGKLHLLKKFKTKTRSINLGTPSDEESNTELAPVTDSLITEVIIEFELYDAQAALVHIGKRHKLFTDGPTGSEKDPIHIKHITEKRPSADPTE